MAQLKALALKKQQAKAELKAFKALLDGKGQGVLSEATDLLPFFDVNEHLCALMGMYNPQIVDYKDISIAREFSIFGAKRFSRGGEQESALHHLRQALR